MRPTATHNVHDTTPGAGLFMACELRENPWTLGFSIGHGQTPQARPRTARALKRLLDEVAPGHIALWSARNRAGGQRRRVLRVDAHDTVLRAQMAAGEAARRALLQSAPDASLDTGRQWMPRRGIGSNGSGLVVREFFAWRARKNRRAGGAERAEPRRPFTAVRGPEHKG
jgi:hypothetical protein